VDAHCHGVYHLVVSYRRILVTVRVRPRLECAVR
jgi:hypothetical protein